VKFVACGAAQLNHRWLLDVVFVEKRPVFLSREKADLSSVGMSDINPIAGDTKLIAVGNGQRLEYLAGGTSQTEILFGFRCVRSNIGHLLHCMNVAA